MHEAAPEIVLRMRGVGKKYPVGKGLAHFLHALAPSRIGNTFDALQDITFDLARGDALGIVGRNGAGKSTLLQIGCGTLTASSGQVERIGRIAAMLELGAGFKPEFTGRENVYLNASVYGLTDEEIDARFDRIAAFADIGPFMERPVAEYSSGMFARLAFAVCAHVDADILIVDEVLAVGDSAFQAKCRNFMEGFLDRGAILFVSHDEQLVLSVCNKAIWLENGKPAATGETENVLRSYRHRVETGETDLHERAAQRQKASGREARAQLNDPRQRKNPVAVSPFRRSAPTHGDGGAIIDEVCFVNDAGEKLSTIQGGQKVSLVISGRAMRDLRRPIAGFIFRDRSGQNLFGDNTYLKYRSQPVFIEEGGRFRATLSFDLPFLPDGTYSIAPSMIEGSQQNHIHLCWMEEALVLTVHASPVAIGKIGVPTEIEVDVS